MSERKITCSAGHAIIAGTLYCWRCTDRRQTLAELSADHGQLLWATTRSPTKREVAMTVFLDGGPVEVIAAGPPRGQPICVELELRVGSSAVRAKVPLREILRALSAEGGSRERVDARRTE